MCAHTITNPDGSFAMRVTRMKAGHYRIMANLRSLDVDEFYASLRMFYNIGVPSVEGTLATFPLEIRLAGYLHERNNLMESLANIYNSALSIHHGHYYFQPRVAGARSH